MAAELWDELLKVQRHEQRLMAAVAAVATHPELTSLYGVLDCVVLLATDHVSTAGCIATVQRVRSAVNRDTEQAVECAAKTLSSMALTELCVLSHSGTVNRVLERLAQQNIRHRVLCSESRPLLEGRRTAENMVAMGHSVVFCSDAQIVGMVIKDGIVVLGCDRIGNDRFRNKVGSLPLILGARHNGASTMLVSGSDKLVDPRIPWLPPCQESTSELWNGSPHGVEVDNRYFEDVPFSLVDLAVIGNQQILDPSGVYRLERPEFHEKTVAIISAILSGKTRDITTLVKSVLDES